jgi:hypothetical protein
MGVREKEVGAGGTSGGASVTDQQKSAAVVSNQPVNKVQSTYTKQATQLNVHLD